jgi:hypothetical protein
MKTARDFWSYLAQFFLGWEIVHTKVAGEIKTQILCSITFFFENRAFYEIIWKKYCTAGQARDNMAHAHCMLDTQGYEYTLRLFNAECFSTSTIVAPTRLNIKDTHIVPLVNYWLEDHLKLCKAMSYDTMLSRGRKIPTTYILISVALRDSNLLSSF